MFGLKDSQVILFMILLCEVSKKNRGSVEINLEYVSAIRQTSVEKIDKDLQELVARGVVTAEPNHQTVPDVPATYIQTNITNKHNIAQSGDFASFWIEVPRKVGKEKAEKSYYREIKAGISHETIMAHLQRFKQYHRDSRTEAKFIPHASTFINNHREWADPTHGQSEDFSDKPPSIDSIPLTDYSPKDHV